MLKLKSEGCLSEQVRGVEDKPESIVIALRSCRATRNTWLCLPVCISCASCFIVFFPIATYGRNNVQKISYNKWPILIASSLPHIAQQRDRVTNFHVQSWHNASLCSSLLHKFKLVLDVPASSVLCFKGALHKFVKVLDLQLELSGSPVSHSSAIFSLPLSNGQSTSCQRGCLFCYINFAERRDFFYRCESRFAPLPVNHHLPSLTLGLYHGFHASSFAPGSMSRSPKVQHELRAFFPAGNVDMEATTIPASTACLFCECSATAHLQVVSFHILCFNHADCHAPHFLEECPSWSAVWRSRIGDQIVETDCI